MVASFTFALLWFPNVEAALTRAEDAALVDALLAREDDGIRIAPQQRVRACRRALETRNDLTNIEEGELWHHLATAHAELKQVPEGLQAIKEALRLPPDNEDTQYMAAVLQMFHTKDVEPFLAFCRAHPDQVATLATYADLMEANGRFDTAMAVLDTAAKAASDDKDELAHVERTRYRIYERRGEYQEALRMIDRVIALWPDSPRGRDLTELFLLRSDLNWKLGDLEEAEADLGRVLRLSPDHPEALKALFDAKCRKHQYHAALLLAHRFMRVTQGSELARYTLAVAHFTAGRDREAEEALEGIPAGGEFADHIATLRASLAAAQGDIVRAAGQYKTLVEAASSRDPKVVLGGALLFSRDTAGRKIRENLRAVLERGAEVEPEVFGTEAARAVRALVLGNLGYVEEAEEILNELNPDDLPAEYRQDVAKLLECVRTRTGYEPKVNYYRWLHTDARVYPKEVTGEK